MPTSCREWEFMDRIRPPHYICLKRRPSKTQVQGSPDSFQLDGDLMKLEWQHVPWSEEFVDIEGLEKYPNKQLPRTRMKMMYDDSWLYIGAELMEQKVWGTLTTQNATMYHQNDFEVFLNPDGSRHNYYELELNCLNVIWELVLNQPYKDGYSIKNPYNLQKTRTAVKIDGTPNDPKTKCNKWSVEVMLSLDEMVQFDRLRRRKVHARDVWRMNFSRVQYELEVVDGNYAISKVKTDPENIVWAPTGVIDIHRPEKWGFVLFSSFDDLKQAQQEEETLQKAFLQEQIAMERILDTIYYDQRVFLKKFHRFACRMSELYGEDHPGYSGGLLRAALTPFRSSTNSSMNGFRHESLLKQFNLQEPVFFCRHHHFHRRRGSSNDDDEDEDERGQHQGEEEAQRRRLKAAEEDVGDDDTAAEILAKQLAIKAQEQEEEDAEDDGQDGAAAKNGRDDNDDEDQGTSGVAKEAVAKWKRSNNVTNQKPDTSSWEYTASIRSNRSHVQWNMDHTGRLWKT